MSAFKLHIMINVVIASCDRNERKHPERCDLLVILTEPEHRRAYQCLGFDK